MEKKAIKETRMEYRALGKTGLSVSRLGLGGIPVQRTDAEGARALVGELLDLDAYTGGYNLQIAFSTGALAGENAAWQCACLE